MEPSNLGGQQGKVKSETGRAGGPTDLQIVPRTLDFIQNVMRSLWNVLTMK